MPQNLFILRSLTVTIVRGEICTNGLDPASMFITKANIAAWERGLHLLGFVLFVCFKGGDENRYKIQKLFLSFPSEETENKPQGQIPGEQHVSHFLYKLNREYGLDWDPMGLLTFQS